MNSCVILNAVKFDKNKPENFESNTVEPRSKAPAYKAMSAYKAFK